MILPSNVHRYDTQIAIFGNLDSLIGSNILSFSTRQRQYRVGLVPLQSKLQLLWPPLGIGGITEQLAVLCYSMLLLAASAFIDNYYFYCCCCFCCVFVVGGGDGGGRGSGCGCDVGSGSGGASGDSSGDGGSDVR